MQTASPRFHELAQGHVRPLSWQLRASFDKTFEPGIGFFVLSSDDTPMSLLDGTDVLAFSDDDIVQEWDKYDYADYSDRAVQIEYSREEDMPYSVNLAMADIQLNNYDNLFTKGAGSPLEANLLPRRPFRILAGFGGENIPQFVGLSDYTPKANYQDKIASVHCVDFLSFLFERPLDETVIMQEVKTHEVLAYLFELAGLLPDQYVLEESFNKIAFVYFEKGKKLGQALRELMQAELGRLYMDSTGVIRFQNRERTAGTVVYDFDKSMIEDYEVSDETKIINVVEIKANVRRVQPSQPIYTLSEPQTLLNGEDTEIFLSLTDPITSLSELFTYKANSQADGQGTDLSANINIEDVEEFATAVKITFSNSGALAYLTELELIGTPAKQVGPPVYARIIDQDSIDKYEEQVLTIDNDFVQTQDAANSLGLTLLNYYSEYNNTIEMTVKGNHALQIRDNIHVSIDNIDQDFTITKITNILSKGKFTQRISARVFNIINYFTLSSDDEARSLLNGGDLLAP